MLDLITASGFVDIVERTASTPRVQAILELSLAPVFLLAGIGAFLNVMNGRLTWLVERIDILEDAQAEGRERRGLDKLPVLRRRQFYAHHAVNFSTGAALMICLVVALLFVSAFVSTALGTLVAACWILAMSLISAGLIAFLREASIATRNLAETQDLANRLAEREGERRAD